MFGCMFLAMNIVDMLSIGLDIANRAIGKIGKYTMLTFTPKLLILPISYIGLHCGMSLLWVCVIFVAIEFLSMLLRIYFMKDSPDFSATKFCKSVIFRSIPPSSRVCIGMLGYLC